MRTKLAASTALLLVALSTQCFGQQNCGNLLEEGSRKYLAAANHGDANAQFAMGTLYELGCVDVRDDVKAVDWYRKSAEQDHPFAQYLLGNLFYRPKIREELRRKFPDLNHEAIDDWYKGQRLGGSFQEAIKWFQISAAHGVPSAQANLAEIYASGQRGVPRDDQLAYFWYLLATSDGGELRLQQARDEIEAKLSPQQRADSQRTAREWKPKPAKIDPFKNSR